MNDTITTLRALVCAPALATILGAVLGSASALDVVGGGNFGIMDADGDGRTDVTVWDAGSGTFYSSRSSLEGTFYALQTTPIVSQLFTQKMLAYDAQGHLYANIPSATIGVASIVPVTGDWDGDGRTDYGVYIQPVPFGAPGSTAILACVTFQIRSSLRDAIYVDTNDSIYSYIPLPPFPPTFNPRTSNASNYIPLSGNYTGSGRQFDGKPISDFTVYDPYTSTFLVDSEDHQTKIRRQFGGGIDGGWHRPTPVVGDFDGDGRSDFAVFEPDNATFYILCSSNGAGIAEQFGDASRPLVPFVADFDGDGKDDVAICDPSSLYCAVLPTDPSHAAYLVQFAANPAVNQANAVPLFGDYNGDGRGDLGLFLPGQADFGIWWSPSSPAPWNLANPAYRQFGPAPVSIPVPGRVSLPHRR